MSVTVNNFRKPDPTTPLEAIRMKCLDCCGDIPKEVKECTVDDCPLYIYRFGKYPRSGGR